MQLNAILEKNTLTREELTFLLALTDKEEIQALFDAAYRVKERYVGKVVYFRGIIEFSNLCVKNCYYCGIRKGNRQVERFSLSEKEILETAEWIFENQYASLVLQSGERADADFIAFIENILKKIKKIGNGKLGVTLSLGEQTAETYKRWFDAGAHRYLLRIESSTPDIYRRIHPPECSFDNRIRCLEYLRNAGYQVGTGVMIGIPGQTVENLADDVLFFKKMDVDMIGMGPFIPHRDTPMSVAIADFDSETQLELGLKMVAVTRLLLKDVNIAAATALQALRHDGREMGLKAGANIIMPNATATEYRAAYQLYDNKPCLDENSNRCTSCLAKRIASCDETIGFGKWGDSPHFKSRMRETEIPV